MHTIKMPSILMPSILNYLYILYRAFKKLQNLHKITKIFKKKPKSFCIKRAKQEVLNYLGLKYFEKLLLSNSVVPYIKT